MEAANQQAERDRVWNLIKDAHSAVLVTVGPGGVLQSRPMGCLQKAFDGVLWFLTFSHSVKIEEIASNERVLVSYADPAKYEYASVTGRARALDDRAKIKELWSESLRVWFPDGPDNPELILIAVEVDEAAYWTNAASLTNYAWKYVRAAVTGEPAKGSEVADTNKVRF
jgi:general stress protein 26